MDPLPEATTESSLSIGQWSMRSLLLATAAVALGLGIWRIDETLGAIYALIAAPSMALSVAERYFRLPLGKLLGGCLDVFMAGGALFALGYCSGLIVQTAAGGDWGSALLQIIMGAACGAAFGVAYCVVVVIFYLLAKTLLEW